MIAKRQIIVVVRVPLMGGAIAGQGVVQGHVFPSTGLASLPGGRFVSCSRDRNVLQFTSPEHLPGTYVPHTHTHACESRR